MNRQTVKPSNRQTPPAKSPEWEAAERAFRLWHEVAGNRTEKFSRISGSEEPAEPVSVHTMMLEKLSGYWVSYVKAGKPYPQPYFGFGLEYLLDGREDKERLLLGCAAMAAEAARIFRRIARDPSANAAFADRFAYECENAGCIANDWLALLRIYDLIADGDTAEAARLARRREIGKVWLCRERSRGMGRLEKGTKGRQGQAPSPVGRMLLSGSPRRETQMRRGRCEEDARGRLKSPGGCGTMTDIDFTKRKRRSRE